MQGAVTSQVNAYHQLKAGGDFQRHTLRLYNHYFPVQLGGDTPNLVDYDGYGYNQEVTYKDVLVRDITEGDTDLDTAYRATVAGPGPADGEPTTAATGPSTRRSGRSTCRTSSSARAWSSTAACATTT